MNEEKGKSRCSDGESRILKCDYFTAGNSNPAAVPLAAQAHVIFNHKIVLTEVIEKGLPFDVN